MSRRQLLDLGDSCSRDNTPSSIGQYDLDDNFIDDGSITGSVGRESPGLFYTPQPDSIAYSVERDALDGNQSLDGRERQLWERSVDLPGFRPIRPQLERRVSDMQSGTPVRSLSGLRRAHLQQAGHIRLSPLSSAAPGSSPSLRSVSVHSSVSSRVLSDSGSSARRKRIRQMFESDGSSDDEPVMQRMRRQRQRERSSSSQSLRSVLLRRSSELGGSSRRCSGTPVSARSDRSSARHTPGSDTEVDSSDEGDGLDPFTAPGHIRLDENPGYRPPGKRLGKDNARFVGRHFLFTFSQSGPNWPYQDFVDLVSLLGAKYVIGRERHEDGGYHFHCFVDFERTFDWENEHRFCVGSKRLGSSSRCPGLRHGNILPIKATPYHTYDYVRKYGDVVACTMDRPAVTGGKASKDDHWKGSLSESTRNGFLDSVRDHSPRDFVVFGQQIGKFAERRFGAELVPPQVQENAGMGLRVHWLRYPAVRQWVRKVFTNPVPTIESLAAEGNYDAATREEDQAFIGTRGPVKRRPPSLILYGGSKLGKTDFARSLGPHCHFRGSFNQRTLLSIGVDNIDYIIWDDVSWKDSALKNENYKNWMGGQDRFTISDKFERKMDVTWGKPCIFLSNKDPLIGLPHEDVSWLEANCIIVHLGDEADVRTNAIAEADVYT